jgi:DNA-binding protein H-NS
MRKKIVLPILLLSFIIGIFVGQSVFAGGVTPGSEGDPLVTKAFVESALNSQLSQLQQQVAQLQNEANNLRQQVAFLENKIGTKAPIQSPPTNNSQQQPSTVTPPQSSEAQPKQKVAYVKQSNSANTVNTRSGAGTSYSIVAKVSKGSKMIILDEQNDWYRVKLEDGKLAWVANWVVDVVEE